jgi:5-methylcytosine-specific restriction endonuclease McrA
LLCGNCKKERKIINVKYTLCIECNSIRLHGKSQSERQAKSVVRYRSKKLIKNRDIVKQDTPTLSSIRKQSFRESIIKNKISQLKRSIELEAIQNNEYYCAGCGISYVGLDKSHILSVGQYKHLELIKENIQLMCRECHVIWESGTIDEKIKLNCFVNNMTFIKSYDKIMFNKLMNKIEYYH